MKKILILLFLMNSFAFVSQEKFEKEYRIKPTEAPQKSSEFINNLNFKKKVKWYAEESNDGKSFEAKTCHLKHLYSIEFTENGTLIDVEKKVSLSELEIGTQNKLNESLSKRFKKYKFKKIQIQYKGLENEVKKVFSESLRKKIKARIFYEVVVKAKKENSYALYEVLFDEKGNIIKELKFKAINSLNLEF